MNNLQISWTHIDKARTDTIPTKDHLQLSPQSPPPSASTNFNNECCFISIFLLKFCIRNQYLFKLNFNSLKSVPGQVWTELKVL